PSSRAAFPGEHFGQLRPSAGQSCRTTWQLEDSVTGPQSSKPPLIGADRLAASLNDQRLVVLDASWYLPASGRDPDAEFRAAHIPGAVRFDLEKVSDPTSDLPHMLPTASRFAA